MYPLNNMQYGSPMMMGSPMGAPMRAPMGAPMGAMGPGSMMVGAPSSMMGSQMQMMMMMAVMTQWMQILLAILTQLTGGMPGEGAQGYSPMGGPNFGSSSSTPNIGDFLGGSTGGGGNSGSGPVTSAPTSSAGEPAPAPAPASAGPAPAATTPPASQGEQWIDPSDVHLYNLAREAERRAAAAQGRTVQVDGQYVDPSDVHLHNQAREAEQRAAAARVVPSESTASM